MKSKVFGIGFHKTGTKSLANALRHLGYKVTGPNNTRDLEIKDKLVSIATRISHQYDGFQDNPWPLVYREMDCLHTDAKFILTLRDPDQWIRSAVKYFGSETTVMRQLIYGAKFGSPVGNETHYKRCMLTHNNAVIDYFCDRPDKLLMLDICGGDGWGKLVSFLNCQSPDVPFPKENASRII